ncbi:MAG: hypothetical protein KDD67_18650 [Ignavibacteriae bacterium]|nr:hypothetical protein [Ignavibacteriota bacterium]MCB9217524.1 hypothetical protein [Ignavibacteria bacterium]
MGVFRRGLLLLLFCSICGIAEGQDRDVRGERLIIDDGSSNLIILQTPAGPIVGGTLTIPDPAGAGTLLVSNPTIGWQSVDGNLLLGGELRFLESGIGPEYVGFLAPAAVSANTIWTLPAADGTNGQVLTTDGAGVLSWGTAGGGAGVGEPYLTASASGTLSAERVLTAGTGVSVVDGGANSTMTVAIGQSVATSATPTFAGVTIPTGNINVTTGNFAITTGNISTTIGNISTTTGSITTTAGSVGTLSGNLYADNGGELRLFEPDGSGSEYTAFKSGAQSGNITYTLPATNGTAGQVLRVASAPAPTGTAATLEWGTASGATGLASVGGMVFVRKGSDESVVSSTTLQNDDDLVIALNANETYQVEGIFYVTTTNAGHDFQIAFTVPSGTTMKLPYSSSRAGSTNYLENDVLTTSGSAGTVVDLASGSLHVVSIRGTVRTGGNSGDLQLQWADDNTGGTQTVTVETDSFLKVTRVE